MKISTILLTMLLALLLIMQSCNDEQERATSPKEVSFGIGLLPGTDASGRVAAAIPDGASVLITLTKPDGMPVLTQHRLEILKLGEGYFTAPLRLDPGDYWVTDFWVVQDSSDVLFLTPKEGSPLAEYVTRPLPSEFQVGSNIVSNINMEVVPANGHQPEDFGYVSFTIAVVDIPGDTVNFRVSVFVENESGGLVLTDAEAVLIQEWESPFTHYPLTAGVNTLNLAGTGLESGFRLHVNKPGYISGIYDISVDVIVSHGNEPLTVVLRPSAPGNSPAITFGGTTWSTGGGYHIMFDFEEAATLYVDWGDGFTEKFTPGPGTFVQRHPYETGNEQTITVRGDLNKIVAFASAYALTTLDVTALVNLKRFSASNTSLNHIDLSNMTKLEGIWLTVGGGPVLLPSEHNIHNVFVSHWGEDYAAFVGNIFNNAVNKNIRDGAFVYGNYVDDLLPGAVIDQLETLRVEYSWTVAYH